MAFEIRTGRRRDADGITDVQVASWRAGYADVLPDEVLYDDDFEPSRRSFWHSWRFAPGHRIAVVADPTDGGRIVGFTSYGPERERDRDRHRDGSGEVWAFYLHPDVWGSGAADALMRHTEERLRAERFRVAVLWVLRDNPRARRFYERHGWRATGTEADYDAYCDVRVPEIEYRKELG